MLILKPLEHNKEHMFWSDLAAAHHSCETIRFLRFLEDPGDPVVKRSDNPSNVPPLTLI